MIRINDYISVNDLETTDLHMHTFYCDGKNSPDEMVFAAIKKGMTCIGFSGHSYVDFDPLCGMSEENELAYRQDIEKLKEAYGNQIEIYCGLELDYDSEELKNRSDYDYIIGSVHYIEIPQGYAAVDDSPEMLEETVNKHFGGDFYLAAEHYFERMADVVNKTKCDIIGHFDLFSKFNEEKKWFDEAHPRYVAAWKKAADALIKTGKVFEINSGAITRGWRSISYPRPEMIEYIKDKGGQLIYSSDSHSIASIGYIGKKSLLA